MSVRRTIARNTIFNALGRVWEALISLVLTWYVVQRVGTGGLGLWSLVGVFASYAALFDFGVASGFAKYIAEHAARSDRRAVSSVVSTGFYFYLLFGALIVVAAWPLIDVLMERVVLPRAAVLNQAPDADVLRFLLRGALVLFAANGCFAPFAAVPTGVQRMGVTNVVSGAATVLKCIATVIFLEMGHGIPGLLYANGLTLVFVGAASIAVAFWLMPGLRVSPGYVTMSAFHHLFAFGWRTQVAKVSNLINFQTDRIVTAFFYADMGLVGLYRLGEDLAGKMRQLPALVVTALLPAASDLDARNRAEDLQRLYLISTKYMASAAVPLTLFFIAAADMLMRGWLGTLDGLDTAAWVLRILAVGYLANLLPGPGVSIVMGKGRADMPMYAGLISTGSNIALTVLLMLSIGFYGIPIATTLGMAISTAWFFAAMRRVLPLPLGTVLRQAVLWPFLASLPGVLLCFTVQFALSTHHGHLPNLIAVAGCAGIFGLSYVVIIGASPFLDRFDVAFLEDTLKLGGVPGLKILTWRARRA